MVFIPFCYAEAAANVLTNPQLDPIGKIPEFKFCAARVEPLGDPRGGGVVALAAMPRTRGSPLDPGPLPACGERAGVRACRIAGACRPAMPGAASSAILPSRYDDAGQRLRAACRSRRRRSLTPACCPRSSGCWWPSCSSAATFAARQPLTEAEWRAFAAEIVTPNFPDGFTVFDGEGQWRNPATGRIAQDPTKILLVAAQTDARSARPGCRR